MPARNRTYLIAFPCLLFVLLTLPPMASLRAQMEKETQFDHLRVEDGLSQGMVLAMLQDSRGFMWFGTYDGLNRYDGYRFTVWRSDPDNVHSLSSSMITALAEDSSGRIWIGTAGGGLNMYDPVRDEMRRYPGLTTENGRSGEATVNALCIDHSGTIWIASDGDGLYAFRPADSTVRAFRHRSGDSLSIAGDFVSDIRIADSTHLWLGISGIGVDLMNTRSGQCRHYRPVNTDKGASVGTVRLAGAHAHTVYASLATQGVYRVTRHDMQMSRLSLRAGGTGKNFVHFRDIMTDRRDRLWVATESNGLFLRDPESGTVRRIMYTPFSESSIPNAGLISLCQDSAGNVWVGTNGRGVSFTSPARKNFGLLRVVPGKEESISIRSFRGVYQDRDSVLWIGGYGGFNRVDRRTGAITVYPRLPLGTPRGVPVRGLLNTNVYSIHPDPEAPARRLLIGTEGDGIYRFDKRRALFVRLPIGSETDPRHPMGRAVYAFHLDSEGDLWIGSSAGLSVYRRQTKSYEHFTHDADDPTTICDGSVRAIFQDSNEHLWIGTDRGGLCYFDMVNGDFMRFQHDPDDVMSISSNRINCIYEDNRGMLWIGTATGLNLMDRRKSTFRRYNREDGLPNNMIYAIEEDLLGYLWISTNRGIARFHPYRGFTEVYDISDGLQGDEFNMGASFRSPSGELFFGGVNGLTYFYPRDIGKNTYIPPVHVTRCTVDGHDVGLKTDEQGRKLLEIESSSNIVSFEFAALNFYRPERNRYIYKLDGVHDHWNDAGDDRSITFLTLPPGTYTLHVKGSNNDNRWNQHGVTVLIRVAPPFWGTWWFRVIAALMLIGIGTAVVRWRLAIVRSQEIALGQTVEDRTAELRHANVALLQEIEERKRAEQEAYRANATKTEFLAHLSHEIRTPMNAILGFTELLAARIKDEQLRGFLRSIEISGSTLLTLINDILDLSKIEAGRIELELQPVDLREVLRELEQVFAFQIEKKGLTFNAIYQEELPSAMMLDRTRVRQILFNLVGNAVKYTEQGSISVEVRRSDVDEHRCTLHLLVSDTGIGIPPSQQKVIFEPFRQGTRMNSSDTRGTGLGLAITQRLVSVMGGSIRLESKLGQGSTFHIVIPAVEVVEQLNLFIREPADIGEKRPVSRDVPPPDKAPESLRSADAEDLSQKRREELQDLHDTLVRDLLPRWKKVSRSFHIQEMEEFARDVRDRADAVSYEPLTVWSEELLKHARNFDMDLVPRTLHRFGELVGELKARISTPPTSP